MPNIGDRKPFSLKDSNFLRFHKSENDWTLYYKQYNPIHGTYFALKNILLCVSLYHFNDKFGMTLMQGPL